MSKEDLLIASVPGLGRAIPAEDAARILEISRQGILNAVRRGHLRGDTRARILWIHLGDLRRYAERRRIGRPPKAARKRRPGTGAARGRVSLSKIAPPPKSPRKRR